MALVKGYVKSMGINFENPETPELFFGLMPSDTGIGAKELVYCVSSPPLSPHAFAAVEKLVATAYGSGAPLTVTYTGKVDEGEAVIVSMSK